jgi:hypothetical protein
MLQKTKNLVLNSSLGILLHHRLLVLWMAKLSKVPVDISRRRSLEIRDLDLDPD